jgi:alpha-1,2-mannosyltransferase
MDWVDTAQGPPPAQGLAARWRDAALRATTHSLLVWPPIAVAWVLIVGWRRDAIAFDFLHAYLPAARDVLSGLSPYPPASVEVLSARESFLYPPLTAYLAAPFTLLPTAVTGLVASSLAIGCVFAALRVMGVTDWRCYSIVLLWLPTYSVIQTANVTAVVLLALALLWRYRDRKAAPVLAGAVVALKLFLWPVLLWLIATRRYRAAAAGVVATAAFVIVPWAGIGFAGMRDFPDLLELASQVQRLDAYTVAALLAGAMSWGAAHAIAIALGFAVLLVGLALGRRDDGRSYALVIGATLLLSPLVWMHYFVLLLVVIALVAHRLAWLWALPLLFWLSPQVGNGAPWQTALALAVAAVTVGLAVRIRTVRPLPALRPADAVVGELHTERSTTDSTRRLSLET